MIIRPSNILVSWICCAMGMCLSGAGQPKPALRILPAAWAATASGEKWPEIAPAIWNLKATDFPDQSGAVILHERYHFHRRSLERFRRLLVMAESGRGLADFQIIDANITKLEGRTVTSEGKTLPFVQGGDVIKSVLLEGKRESLSALKVIPPGVTGHCVVDVRWFEPIDAEKRPVPDGYGLNMLFSLSNQVPVKLAEVVFDTGVADIDWMRKFQVQPSRKYRQTIGEGQTSYVFEDIPAREQVPLASEGDLRLPVCNWFWAPEVGRWLTYIGFPEGKEISVLDAAACTIFFDYLMDSSGVDRWLRDHLRVLGKGTEKMPAGERSVALIRVLRSKVKTISELPEPPDRSTFKVALAGVLKRGWGTSEQLNLLGFHLLKENGMDVSLVMAIDREDNRLTDPNNIWQYDYRMLSVQDEKGEPVYLNPGSTFAPVGLPPWVQGSLALIVHPGKKQLEWNARILPLPSVNPDQNVQSWTAVIRPEEESDDYEVSFEGSGNAASQWRSRLFEQHRSDPHKALSPLLEQPGFRIQNTASQGMLDPWKNLSFQFRGSLEHAGGRNRVIQPFVFLRAPFQIPHSWPETRSLAIHLPMKTSLHAVARIPWKGNFTRNADAESFSQENAFGKVSWSVEESEGKTGKELVVELTVKVNALLGSPAKYEELKAFSSWILDALNRRVPAPRP